MMPQYIQRIRKTEGGDLVYKIVRPQREKMSRHKFKKQATLINNIANDPLINGQQASGS